MSTTNDSAEKEVALMQEVNEKLTKSESEFNKTVIYNYEFHQ